MRKCVLRGSRTNCKAVCSETSPCGCNFAKNLVRRKRRLIKRLPCAIAERVYRGVDSSCAIATKVIGHVLSERGHIIGCYRHDAADRTEIWVVQSNGRTIRFVQGACDYLESNQILANVINMLYGAVWMEHVEQIRNDETLLNAIGADSSPGSHHSGGRLSTIH